MVRILFAVCAVLIVPSLCAQPFSLADFYRESRSLSYGVDSVYASLDERERVAQMIVTSLGRSGKSADVVMPLVDERAVGGVIFLSGDPAEFKQTIAELNSPARRWPLMMSIDAEPSLFNRRLPGTPPMGPTSELANEQEVEAAVGTINGVLLDLGFHQNFAPVIDLSAANAAIGNRTLGNDSATVVPKALAFVRATQRQQLVATVKHFPGHGRVAGDTHKQLVYINGPLQEVGLYKPMIDAGVLSVMVGHIAIENNDDYFTNGMPSTLSGVVVTDLLRQKMNFKGLIVTDALNMGAVSTIENAPLLAAKAGCDVLLMPLDERQTLESILTEAAKDPAFAAQIEQSVKRILRMKMCLGLY